MKTLLLPFFLLPWIAAAQAPVIEISGATFRPLPLAVAEPRASDEIARALVPVFDGAFMFDLTACGLFQVLDRASFLADAKEGVLASSINFPRWTDVGAEVLVKTTLSGGPGGRLTGQLYLFSVGAGREELKVTHTVAANEARQLAHHFADALYRHFTREPGPFGTRIAYVRRAGADRDVWVADWDGHGGRPITEGGINLLPALGPDGRVGFTSYRKGRPDLYIQRPGGSATPVSQTGQMATGVSFSPDGTQIAYSLSQGETTQIWVAQADGSRPRKLTNTPFGINTSPSWSPDGKQLAFVSNRGGSPQIYVMRADGSGARRLTFQGNYNQTPDWSPRGDLIAFTARDERNAFDLFTVNVTNGKLTRLTQGQGNNEEPSFSPNGRLILFTSTRTGSPHLFVMTADGNNQVPLPLEKGTYLTPDWGR